MKKITTKDMIRVRDNEPNNGSMVLCHEVENNDWYVCIYQDGSFWFDDGISINYSEREPDYYIELGD